MKDEILRLREKMNDIKDRLVDSHSVEERNSLLPPLDSGTDSGYIIHGVAYPDRAPDQQKFDAYSREELRRAMEWMKKHGVIEDKDQPMKPYVVTVEIRARNLREAVELAHEEYGEHVVESVVQKHRMTNVGTEWFKPQEEAIDTQV